VNGSSRFSKSDIASPVNASGTAVALPIGMNAEMLAATIMLASVALVALVAVAYMAIDTARYERKTFGKKR
jgi:hypothetical protein